MKLKLLFIFVLLISVTTTYASSTKYLNSFEEIKNHLLKGGEIKIIINDKTDCKLISKTGPISYSPNTFSINAKQFILNATTGNIIIPIYPDFNAPSLKFNIPATYHLLDMSISPKGEITMEEKGISVLDYKVVISYLTSCVIGDENHDGVKFIPY